MQSFKTDISVLMLFHARPDHFSKVWEEVRKARPARLFLYQDGPRGEKDMAGILACRELVSDENIDWECEVHRNYQEVNQGCDPSGYLSQQWAFSLTDKCIVLEDDVVPSQSFFPFCKEMLDRYENDDRITMIAGFNTDETSPIPSHVSSTDKSRGETMVSYFFTRAFSIWGWASWARVINNRDGEYGFVRNPEQLNLLKQKAEQYNQRRDMIKLATQRAAEGVPYFEFIFWAYMMLHDGMAIMPRVNLINNIGLDGGTHYATQLELQPKRLRAQFEMRRMELDFPLVHPEEVIEYPDYQKRWYLRNAWNNPWRKVQYSLEELWLNLKHGNFSVITKALKNRIKKTLGKR